MEEIPNLEKKNILSRTESMVTENYSVIYSLPSEGKSPISTKKGGKSLLDLIKKDPKAKLWDCILTSIIAINDFCEKGLKKGKEKKISDEPINFLDLAKEKQNLRMQQIIFNIKEKEFDSVVQIKSHSNPLRRLDSRDQKHNMFIERSLKAEKKIDYSMNFKITEYAFELFSYLRKLNNVSIEDIKDSFDIGKNIDLHVANTSEFFGRSGSTFFFTNDNKFVLKSISYNNAINFRNIFPKYFEHLLKNNDSSLMVRIYGLYKVNVEGYEKTFFILMENLMEKLENHLILNVFDLKGSKFQRSQENFKNDLKDQNMILKNIFGPNLDQNLQEISNTFITDQILIVRGKDCDFMDIENPLLPLDVSDSPIFFKHLQEDIKFLYECKLMDYSLIYIKALRNPDVKNEENGNQNSFKKFRSYLTKDKKFIVSLAVVDYLQNYDFMKLMETQLKSFFKENPEEISCVDPEYYQQRFLKFILSLLE